MVLRQGTVNPVKEAISAINIQNKQDIGDFDGYYLYGYKNGTPFYPFFVT